MKKISMMVKQVLMSTLTAGIFAFGFSSCADDTFESPVNNNSAENAQVASNEDGIKKPYGLVYTDFISSNDVQILNADTTMISVSKAYADKMGITDFVNHPMGIWQSLEERAYMRRATAQRLENGKYILNVVRSGLGEVLANQDVVLNTGIYVNPNAGANTRGAAGIANKYTDEDNIIHPAAVAISRRAGESTRGSYNQYGVLSAEQILNGESFNLPQTRGLIGDIYDAFTEFVTFIDNVAKNGVEFKGDKKTQVVKTEGTLKPKKIEIKMGKEKGDTLVINSKIPYDVVIDYTMKLDSKARVKGITEMWDTKSINPIDFTCNYFEGRFDGKVSVAPEMTIGIGGKVEIPEDKQNVKLCDITEFTFTFMAGIIPVAITVQPAIYLHIEAGAEGKVYTGIKYEYESQFAAGVKYDKKNGGWKPIADYKTTKNEFSFIKPRGTFKAEAAVGVLLGCDVLVDMVAGPTLSVGPMLKAGLEAKLALYDEIPFTFEAGIKAGIYGRAGAKIKLWKLELFDWETELTFGPEWDIWSYKYDGKKTSNKDGNSSLAKQVEEMKKEVEEQSAAIKAKNQNNWDQFVAKMATEAGIQNLKAKLRGNEALYNQALQDTYNDAIARDGSIKPESFQMYALYLKSHIIYYMNRM